jgi:CrcB protein
MVLVANVAIGGALGSGSRYLVGAAIQSRAGGDFPLATLIINVVGSLLLGFILEYATGSAAMSPATRLLLSTGFCGGFTTFSTFSHETVRLIQAGEYRRATVYVGLSLILSFTAIVVGYAIARSTFGARRMA